MFRRAVAFTAEIEFDILRDTRSRRLAVYTRTGITFLIKEKKRVTAKTLCTSISAITNKNVLLSVRIGCVEIGDGEHMFLFYR